jgi:outer membrane protein OmpA-like peptidoglycan-associated protein
MRMTVLSCAVVLSSCASSKDALITTDNEEIDPDQIVEIKVVVEKCAVPDLKTYFDFDSDEISKADNLDQLARCLTDGPLRTSKVLLIGSTDPLGPNAYNEKLGLARARKVGAYLMKQGVGEKRIKYVSVGKTHASGKRQEYPKDRRVDINVIF